MHKPSTAGRICTQFSFRVRFFTEEDLTQMLFKLRNLGDKLTDIGEKFSFFRGIDPVEVLAARGVVYDVAGDGNCGYYCLVFALAVLSHFFPAFFPHDASLPVNNLDMRRVIQDNANLVLLSKDAMVSICPHLNEDGRQRDGIQNRELVYADNVAYDDEEFMRDESGDNDKHWMEGSFVLPIFALHYRLRVVLYSMNPPRNNMTIISDGRNGSLTVTHTDGLKPVGGDACNRTIGLVYDGQHYRYLHLKA
jgi:hypothetical protein